MDEINLTGEWHYHEDFGYGTSKGHLVLTDQAGEITGTLLATEQSEDAETFRVKLLVEGKIQEGEISFLQLSATSYEIIEGEVDDYQLDKWRGRIMSDKLIVGEAEDDQGVLGIFTFKRT
ncbi:hypothetical protein [Persicobacter psychrovividus]|uniref:Lipocalin-like domain-containing protein n=1 Tax=Persicobacter psychrovividus TaxID=387638 RepID=A0ABN6LFD4_9BACT|nr:hypothetical protein PEPS_40720 [Persicobacter psychrovividus]